VQQPRDDRPAAIEVKDLDVVLGGMPVLRGINLRVPVGELVAIIGPNGCGKTTLLRTLLGLQPHTRGEIRLLGETDLSKVFPRIGYVPQRLSLERSFILSVREFLALRLPKTRHWFWNSNRQLDALMAGEIDEIGVRELLDRPLAQLSGGQFQRVLIAFSLLQKPDLLLLDEPTAGVDTPGEQSFYELISEVHRRHRLTVVLVSHDLSAVFRQASWVYALNGVICCEGPPDEVINAESLKKAYGIHVTPYHHHHDHVHAH
jgi:ABC-type Mn2+/Zn2+ transport system ATPase subunit